jgi:hypothetical protein
MLGRTHGPKALATSVGRRRGLLRPAAKKGSVVRAAKLVREWGVGISSGELKPTTRAFLGESLRGSPLAILGIMAYALNRAYRLAGSLRGTHE